MDGTLSQQAAPALEVLQAAGAMALAFSVAPAALRRSTDVFGLAAVGLVAALGGGTLRDLLLGQAPVFWMRTPHALVLASAVALVGAFLARQRPLRHGHLLEWSDAAGLGALSIVGTDVCLAGGTGPVTAVVLGGLAGIAGGALRDLLLGRRLLLLREDFYLTAVLLGTCLHVFFVHTPLGGVRTFWVSAGAIVLLRALGIRSRRSVRLWHKSARSS